MGLVDCAGRGQSHSEGSQASGRWVVWMQRVMACSAVDGPGWQLGRRNEARASDVREGSRHRA